MNRRCSLDESEPLLPTSARRAEAHQQQLPPPPPPTECAKLRSVLLLGIAFMLVFAAFQTTAMIQPLVLESVRNESGGAFSGSGLTSLGIVYGSFAVCNWLAPPVVSVFGPKWSMVGGAVVYNFYVSIYLYLSATWLLYAASAIVGVAAAVTWTAQGTFLTINSTPLTMTRNAGIFWALLQCSTIIGNTYVYIELRGLATIGRSARTVLFSGLTGVCFVGCLCMICLKSYRVVTEERKSIWTTVSGAFCKSFRLLKTTRMLLLCGSFLYTGLVIAFTGGVFGTSVGHSSQFGRHAKDLVGLCGIVFGIGEMLGGLLLGLLGDRATRFGRSAGVLFGYVVHLAAFYLVFLSLAEDSPVHETPLAGYVPASQAIMVVCSLLLGFGDGCVNAQLISLLGIAYAEDSSAAFAVFKFMQAIVAAAGFFYSGTLVLGWQLLILLVGGTTCVLSFIAVEAGLSCEQLRRQQQPVNASCQLEAGARLACAK